MITIDIHHPALRADLNAISHEIRGLKRLLRARWTRPMADEQRELCELKRRATELCSLRAFARGRFHLQQAPRDAANGWNALLYHQRIVERLGPSYTITLSESA